MEFHQRSKTHSEFLQLQSVRNERWRRDWFRIVTGMCVVTSDFCPGCGWVKARVVRDADTGLWLADGDRLRDLDFADDLSKPPKCPVGQYLERHERSNIQNSSRDSEGGTRYQFRKKQRFENGMKISRM